MRKFFKVLSEHRPPWILTQNKVLSVQLSYARNLPNTLFPNKETKNQSLNEARSSLLNTLIEKDLLFENNFKAEELNTQERQLLEERLLISKNINNTSALSFNDLENRSIIINQHDHFKIKYNCSWENIEKSYRKINEHDRKIRRYIKFAYDDKLGYLSASPHRLGSGLKISILLSLSSLNFENDISPLQNAALALGLELKSFQPESPRLLWTLQNTCSIGKSEEDILDNTKSFCFQLLAAEKRALHELIKSESTMPHNLYSRTWWGLRASHSITQDEAKIFAEQLLCARLDNYANQYTAEQALDCCFLTQNTHLKAQEQNLSTDQLEKLRFKSFCDLIRPLN